jgi:hypothetical protein
VTGRAYRRSRRDAVVIALVVRSVLRSGGPDRVREHWRGPQRSLDALLRLA